MVRNHVDICLNVSIPIYKNGETGVNVMVFNVTLALFKLYCGGQFCWLWKPVWFVLLNATLAIFQVYCGNQFYLWRKPEYPEKTTNLPHVSDKLYHILLNDYEFS